MTAQAGGFQVEMVIQDATGFQIRQVRNSTKRKVMTALQARITALGIFKLVDYRKIRLLCSDFQDHELPACQLIAMGEEPKREGMHHHNRLFRSWVIRIEVVFKSSENGYVTQDDLWDAQEEIERQLGGQAQLKDLNTGKQIPGFMDLNYRATLNDLHFEEPFFTLHMEISANFYTDFTGMN